MPGHEIIGEEERAAVLEVFDRGGVLYRRGFEERRGGVYRVAEFEDRIAERVGADYSLVVTSGTAALKLALVGLGVGEGDEVITQSHTFVATLEAALELGAEPVVTEVDETLNMDPQDLARKVGPDTAAIVPVHMYGVAADMRPIMEVAERHDIPVLEDSAWAFGSTYNGTVLGTLGDVGSYSFNFGKTITAGEGGAVVTDDEEIYRTAKEYSNHGHEDRPDLPAGEDTRSRWGFNYKLDELRGAVGLAQLSKLERVLDGQRERKARLRDQLAQAGVEVDYRERPNIDGESGRALCLRLDTPSRAAATAERLEDIGVGTLNLPGAIKWHFAGEWTHVFDAGDGNLESRWERSAAVLRRTVAIPISLQYHGDDLDAIVEAVLKSLD